MKILKRNLCPYFSKFESLVPKSMVFLINKKAYAKILLQKLCNLLKSLNYFLITYNTEFGSLLLHLFVKKIKTENV